VRSASGWPSAYPPRRLAVRPLLFAAQVALLGTVLGMAVGWALTIPLRDVFVDILPLPVWYTPLQAGTFAQAAALGFALPFAAALWPVWRALRAQPVDAIRVGHLAARGGGLAPLLRRLRLPGRGYHHIPIRNVLRTPRRSVLTALGIAAAVTTLVTTVGFLDTFHTTLDKAEAALLHTAPDRVTVSLDGFHPADGDVVRSVAGLPETGITSPGLLLPATAVAGDTRIDLLAEVIRPGAPWTPMITPRRRHRWARSGHQGRGRPGRRRR
jgi:putative ABC transport system permease protein